VCVLGWVCFPAVNGAAREFLKLEEEVGKIGKYCATMSSLVSQGYKYVNEKSEHEVVNIMYVCHLAASLSDEKKKKESVSTTWGLHTESAFKKTCYCALI
jgi:hypothetical protein